jgi:hypothetical protein
MDPNQGMTPEGFGQGADQPPAFGQGALPPPFGQGGVRPPLFGPGVVRPSPFGQCAWGTVTQHLHSIMHAGGTTMEMLLQPLSRWLLTMMEQKAMAPVNIRLAELNVL